MADNPYPAYPQQGQPPAPGAQPDMQGAGGEQPFYTSKDVEKVEEVAEAIIDEKWNELVKNINKIIEWKDKTESRITTLEQEFKDLKEMLDQKDLKENKGQSVLMEFKAFKVK